MANYRIERNLARPLPLISWKAVLGGFFVALITYAILIALGVGIGGLTFKTVNENGLMGLTIGSGIWMIVSTIISLFVGGFIAARFSAFIGMRMASIQGVVVASIFFLVMTIAIGTGLSAVAKIVGYTAGAASATTMSALDQPAVRDLLDDAIGDLNLKADPKVVAQGVASRLVRGDAESAKNYLAFQAGISREEADQKIVYLQGRFQEAMDKAQQAIGNTVAALGWTEFLTLLLGALGGFFGGGLGARVNTRKPLADIRGETLAA